MLAVYIRFLLFCLCFCVVESAIASDYSVNTRQTIHEGDSMEAVQATWGSPTYVRFQDEKFSIPMEITQWVYMPSRPANISKSADYLARLIIVFDDQGKVIKLRQSELQDAEGHPNEPNTVSCGAMGVVKLGDNLSSIEFGCGQPTFINKLQSSREVVKKVIEWQYQKSADVAPTVLRFEDGILKKIIGQS
jgi:hypothetical protein